MTISTADALGLLDRTPTTLHTWLTGLPEAWIDANEGPETFSPRDVVAHLVQGEEDDWMQRLRIILEHGEDRVFDPFDRFDFRERFAGASTTELLDRFEVLRGENLAALHALGLGADDLLKTGTHPDFGRVTLGQLLSTWVVHDLGHLGQIARVLAKQLRDDVGPWRAYLPILDRP
jgi:hypothetical protein